MVKIMFEVNLGKMIEWKRGDIYGVGKRMMMDLEL